VTDPASRPGHPDQRWSAAEYARHAAFVPALGRDLIQLLAPCPGERVLDLGCGDGTLTIELAARGAAVVGVDRSPSMAAAAHARGLPVVVADATRLVFSGGFDAVFSNAVLHWVRDADAVLDGVYRALAPGGRFVAELGGHGNVAAIVTAVRAVLRHRGIEPPMPWDFPTADACRDRLEQHGFAVDRIVLFPRPTRLPPGLAGWLQTFAGSMLEALPAGERAAAAEEIEELLRPALCDCRGVWTADYVRLRFAARRP